MFLLFAGTAWTSARKGKAIMPTAKMFTDNMVLQRGRAVPVWGWAEPGERVCVEFAGQCQSGVANRDGRWTVRLEPMEVSHEGRRLCIRAQGSSRQTVFQNVVVGDVWLAGGQSNMRKPIAGGSLPADAECPDLRLFRIDPSTTPRARDLDATAGWAASSLRNFHTVLQGPDGLPFGFSQVGYCFGRRLQERLGIPIGVIQSAYGGSTIEAWIENPEAETALALDMPIENGNHRPGVMYRCMLRDIVPFAMRGIAWYQGESDVNNPDYTDDMQRWIAQWRARWSAPDLPVCFVQIAPTGYGNGSMNRVWGCQARFAAEDPHAWMAPTNDVYMGHELDYRLKDGRYLDSSDPHPPNLHMTGQRLANIALAEVYDVREREVFGPAYASHAVQDDGVHVAFAHCGRGLMTRDGKAPTWFEVAGPDGIFADAAAEIAGASVIRLRSRAVAHPTAVRLAWHGQAVHNLMNSEGLPALPFTSL
jgi:sialate O-acetylesterase